jgi:hypothetical protein
MGPILFGASCKVKLALTQEKAPDVATEQKKFVASRRRNQHARRVHSPDYQPKTFAKIKGATIVASDSII